MKVISSEKYQLTVKNHINQLQSLYWVRKINEEEKTFHICMTLRAIVVRESVVGVEIKKKAKNATS